MRKLMTIALCFCIMVSVTACSQYDKQEIPAESQETFVNDVLPEPSEQETISEVSATSTAAGQTNHVQYTYENGNQSIVIDADVSNPSENQMYRYRAEPVELDTAQIRDLLSETYELQDLGANDKASTRLLLASETNTFHLLLSEQRPYIYLGGGEMDLTPLTENIVDSLQAPNCDMTMDEATALALQFNEKLGITGMTPHSVNVYRKNKLTEDGFLVEDTQYVDGFYNIYLVYTLDGVLLNGYFGRILTPNEQERITLHYSDYVAMQYYIDKDGIQKMRGSAYTFTKIGEAEDLISAQDAVKAVQNGIGELIRQYSALPDQQDGANNLHIRFEKVALEYFLDKPENETIAEPMWHFYAAGDDYGYKDFYVNAITGELSTRR